MSGFFKMTEKEKTVTISIAEQRKKWFKEFLKSFAFLWLTYFAIGKM